MKEMNPVCWFEIYVDDMNRAQKFYENVLQVSLMDLPMPEGAGEGKMLAFPWTDGKPNAAGALVKHEMGKPSATGTIVYFACEDCETELSRVEAAGGKLIAPKFSIGEFGFIGLVSDSEGNTVGFHSLQ